MYERKFEDFFSKFFDVGLLISYLEVDNKAFGSEESPDLKSHYSLLFCKQREGDAVKNGRCS